MDVSIGVDAKGFFTAAKNYSLKVIVEDDGLIFSITGMSTAKRKVRKEFLTHIIGACGLLSLGLWSGREVCDGVYFEPSKKAGFSKIRVRTYNSDEKIFIEIPNYEVGALTNYLLSFVSPPLSYSFLDFSLILEKGENFIIYSQGLGVKKEVVFDKVSLSQLSYLIKEAVLGRITGIKKVVGIRGYATVDVHFKVEPKIQEKVEELKKNIKELAKENNTYWVLLMKKTLTERKIDYKTYISLRFGVQGQEDRSLLFIPPVHAYGLSLIFDKFCLT